MIPRSRPVVVAIAVVACLPLAVTAVWLLPWPYWPLVLAALGVLVWVVSLSTLLVEEELERRHSHGLVDGFARLRGARGVALTDLAPTGSVKVAGEVWSARVVERVRLPCGSPVSVVGAHDLVLLVEEAADDAAATREEGAAPTPAASADVD